MRKLSAFLDFAKKNWTLLPINSRNVSCGNFLHFWTLSKKNLSGWTGTLHCYQSIVAFCLGIGTFVPIVSNDNTRQAVRMGRDATLLLINSRFLWHRNIRSYREAFLGLCPKNSQPE